MKVLQNGLYREDIWVQIWMVYFENDWWGSYYKAIYVFTVQQLPHGFSSLPSKSVNYIS